MKKFFVGLFLVTVISFGTVLPLFGPGFFPMHDDTQVGRVIAMGRALKNGQFPVRWVSDLGYGYGYPIFNFYAPLPYYVGGFLYAIGVNGLVATKWMIILGMLLPSVTLYILMATRFGIAPGILSGLFYVFAPYHAVQLYVRGAVGELWALIFFPLLLYGFLFRTEKSRIIGGIGLAGVILSHTLLGFAVTMFVIIGLVLYWLFRWTQKRFGLSTLKSQLSTLFIGLGLSAFFWIPAFLEMGYTNVAGQIAGTANFHDHFVCPGQLWNSLWGFGGSAAGCIDGMSFKLGKIHIIMAVFTVIFWFFLRKRNSRATGIFWVAFIISLLSVFLVLPYSVRVWEIIPYFSYLQYPWRFLSTAFFGLSILSGVGVFIMNKRIIQFVLSSVCLFVLIETNGKLFRPQYTVTLPASSYEEKQYLRWDVSKISDEYLPVNFKRPVSFTEVPVESLQDQKGVMITSIVNKETRLVFDVKSATATDILLNQVYFPGWTYVVNGSVLNPSFRNDLPDIPVHKGSNSIDVQFRDTPVRLFGNMLSAGIFCILVFTYVKKRKTIA